ncbi:hypothetical protein [Bdellovibrio sp. HCB288]|uniref:hypothetical protein n=1 Tax=Bdellovibrio sp. HCB288 TaxID=3394355 RepID=UPI0039B66C5B
MKYSIAFLALIMSCSSFAQSQNQPPNQNPGAPTPPVIFERTRVKVSIYKRTIERVGDTFQERTEDICKKEITIEVPDVRHSNGQTAIPAISYVGCPATFENINFDLNVWIYSMVEHNRIQNQDYKSYYSSMSVGNRPESNTSNITLPERVMAATKQLDLKSMIFNLAPKQGYYCVEQGQAKVSRALPQTKDNCQIFNPVAFGAIVEYESL